MSGTKGRLVRPAGLRGPRVQSTPGLPALACAIAVSGRTLDSLATEVGIQASSMSKIVKGSLVPGSDTRERLAAALGTDQVEALFTTRTIKVDELLDALTWGRP